MRALQRSLFVTAMILGGASLLLSAATTTQPTDDTNAPLAITHGPYLESPRQGAVTIVWFTNKKCVSHVEYGAGEELTSKAVNVQHGLVDAYDTRHVVQLTSLEAGKTYRYRVVSREIVDFKPYSVKFGETISNEVHSFQATDANKKEFSFCVVNDIHEKAARLDAMLTGVDFKGVDLMFLNGDMISNFQRESQIFNGYLDTCVKHFATSLPFAYIRGNHETRGSMARHLMEFMPTPENRFYYSFDHGGVHFIVLDSGEDKPDEDKAYSGLAAFDPYRREQAEWLKKDLASDASRKANFRVVLFHIPTFGGNNWHGDMQVRELWNPLMNAGQVDLLICGHTHQYAKVPPKEGENQYPIMINSNDSLLRVDVKDDSLKVTVTGADQKILGDLQLRKKS